MKLYEEYTANDFQFWAGAKNTVEELTAKKARVKNVVDLYIASNDISAR